MKISTLPEPIKSWAEENATNSPARNISIKDHLTCFLWTDSKEGAHFWIEVTEGKTIKTLKEHFPKLPWLNEAAKEDEFENFRKDLKELLKKHDAELSVEDGTIVVWLNSTADQEEICRGVTKNEAVAITSRDFN